MNSNSEFLTAEELSQLLRIPKRSIYKFAREGQIPGTLRIGKHWRFHEDVVRNWINQQIHANGTVKAKVQPNLDPHV